VTFFHVIAPTVHMRAKIADFKPWQAGPLTMFFMIR
jgi:hypothetical protein